MPLTCSIPLHRHPSKSGSALRFPSPRVAPALQSWGIPQILSSAQLSSTAAAEKAARGSWPALAPSSPAPGALQAPRGTEERSGSASRGGSGAKCMLDSIQLCSFQSSSQILEDAPCPSDHIGCRDHSSIVRREGEISELDGGNSSFYPGPAPPTSPGSQNPHKPLAEGRCEQSGGIRPLLQST